MFRWRPQTRVSLESVKRRIMTKHGPVAERLSVLLAAFSPWDTIALTYRQFAAEIGKPVTEAAIKKLPQRKKFPPELARRIVSRARVRGVSGITLEWLLWGDGPGPQMAPKATPVRAERRC